MKIYTSAKDKAEVKAYKRSDKFYVKVSYEDGTVLTYETLDKDKANKQFLAAKKKHPDLTLKK